MTDISNVASISQRLLACAVNDDRQTSEEKPHEWLMRRINEDIPFIIKCFPKTMKSIVKELDIAHAYQQQDARISHQLETLEPNSVSLSFFESIEGRVWGLAVQSYHDDLFHNNREKYKQILLQLSPEVCDQFQETNQVEPETTGGEFGSAFEKAMLHDVAAYNELLALFTLHFPTLDIDLQMAVHEDVRGRSLITPVLVITSPEKCNLRDLLKDYVNQTSTKSPLHLRPV